MLRYEADDRQQRDQEDQCDRPREWVSTVVEPEETYGSPRGEGRRDEEQTAHRADRVEDLGESDRHVGDATR